MTFTKEQIREAMHKRGIPINETSLVIAELTRSQPEFREGEVYATEAGCYFKRAPHQDNPNKCRKLRLSEMPEAVEKLRKFVDWVAAQGGLLSKQRAEYEVLIATAIQDLKDFDREIEP
jgi:hypothetical protein